MDFEIIYPQVRKKSIFMSYLRYVCGLVFLAAGVACPIVNLAVGGKAWSVVVLWSMIMVWVLVLKQPLVERNLISQGVRLLVMVAILLVLIDVLLCSGWGWALFVVPIVISAALIVLGILFFVNVSKQRHNVMPLIYAVIVAVVGPALALFLLSDTNWPMIVLTAVAAALLIASIFTLRWRLIAEIRKRFHIE